LQSEVLYKIFLNEPNFEGKTYKEAALFSYIPSDNNQDQ